MGIERLEEDFDFTESRLRVIAQMSGEIRRLKITAAKYNMEQVKMNYNAVHGFLVAAEIIGVITEKEEKAYLKELREIVKERERQDVLQEEKSDEIGANSAEQQ